MSFKDLSEQARMLYDSNRLGSVAIGLKKMVKGERLDEKEKGDFTWASDLVEQMNWNYGHYSADKHPELCVIATKLRPSFYENLVFIGIEYETNFC